MHDLRVRAMPLPHAQVHARSPPPRMRFGKSEGVHAIDSTVRRSAGMSLKKAQPGAPFGWCADGTPYIGTQYCVRPAKSGKGFQFASLSTRNGGADYYWKDLNQLSAKVALSALETHGCVSALLANESRLGIGDVFEPAQLEQVRAHFARLVGTEALARMEEVGGEEEEATGTAAAGTAAAGTAAAGSSGTLVPEMGLGVKVDEANKVVGKKRLARMALADEVARENKQPRDLD